MVSTESDQDRDGFFETIAVYRAGPTDIEGSSAVNLLVRIAEVSGDSADYERAFLADTNSVEAVRW